MVTCRTRELLVAVVLFAAAGRAAQAQGAGSGVDIRGGAGLVSQGGVFGDDDPESDRGLGLTLGLQVRGQMHRRTGGSLDVVFQPVGIRNPHFDETLRTLFILAGAEIGRRTYVRPAFGVALQTWSGTSAESGGDLALAAGIAIGRRGVGSPRVGIEAIARCAASPGALGWMLGVNVPVRLSRHD